MCTMKKIHESGFNHYKIDSYSYEEILNVAHCAIQSDFEDMTVCVMSTSTFNQLLGENDIISFRQINGAFDKTWYFEGVKVVINDEINNDIIYIQNENILDMTFTEGDIMFLNFIVLER